MFIPNDLLITLENAKQTPLGKKMKWSGVGPTLISERHAYMAVLLLQEKNIEGSPFSKYFDIFPKSL